MNRVLNINKILQEQDKEGLFPTYRAKKNERIVQSISTEIRNIGIHSFVLERLLELEPNSSRIKTSFQKGLNYLIKEAVNYNGFYLWGWLKTQHSDYYLYPPDYDDIARARTIIELGLEKGFRVPIKFREFDFRRLLEQGLTRHGVLTFIGNKPGNVVCPVVNANILFAYTMHLRHKNLDPNNDEVFNKIKRYLEGVIKSSKFQLPNFSRLSKFYLSHMLLDYLISRQSDIFDANILDIVRERVEKEKGKYRNPLEIAWGTLTLINLRGDKKLIDAGIEQIQELVKISNLWEPEAFYQHQRLGHVFGSSAGTSIFCLEALKKVNKL